MTTEEDVRLRIFIEVGDDRPIGPRVVSEMPASAALSTALTCIPLWVGATNALETEASVGIELGCEAWAELPLPSCAGAVAAELPDGQMVSTSAAGPPVPPWPTAHTCDVSSAFATSNISLSLVPSLEIALGKAVQREPSHCCVEAT